MKYIKNIVFMIVLLFACVFTVNSYAEESSFQCNTNPELIQDMNNALIQKKADELNKEYNPWSEKIQLFQIGSLWSDKLMPSTGDVKVLVVPIEFANEKLENTICDRLQEVYFSEKDLTNNQLTYSDLSFCDYYKKESFNKLRLSGVVLPVYTASGNRNDYAGFDENGVSPLIQEVIKSIQLNKDIIGDLSEYDSDNDGYIDCLHIVWAGPTGEWASDWWAHVQSAGSNTELYNNKKIARFAGFAATSANVSTIAHETGHLLGLPDHYGNEKDECIIPYKLADLMCMGMHINALYKYFLDWEEPEILPYENVTKQIELYSTDIYKDNTIQKKHSIILTHPSMSLPFAEFYIMEYRTEQYDDYSAKMYPGIIIWHCKIEKYAYGETFRSTKDFIKPVYQSNYNPSYNEILNSYQPEDIYRVGDEFSSDTTPSSNFYDDVYTGAYMKVLDMDSDKATVQVGFVNTDMIKQPTISVSSPSMKAVKSGSKVFYTLKYDADELGDSTDIFHDVTVKKTGTATTLQGVNHKGGTLSATVEFDSIKGEGTIGFTVGGRSAWNVSSSGLKKYASSVISETFYVDDTPPNIMLNGDSEIELELGAEYIEQGVKVTDNLDPDIESKLKISGTVNTNNAGTYQIKYNATDHAGNIAEQKVRTVKVIPISANVEYSETKLTNQNVTVTLTPSVQLVTNTELTYTFTENGEHTFTLTDLEGNTLNKTVKVDWID
ncbi:MAG: DUF5011 domain-containing protein, partial [Lachnospiraceae bacterium]|nr:DUF5011 domain-containing protein [Lachnospiraceae bacterium]